MNYAAGSIVGSSRRRPFPDIAVDGSGREEERSSSRASSFSMGRARGGSLGTRHRSLNQNCICSSRCHETEHKHWRMTAFVRSHTHLAMVARKPSRVDRTSILHISGSRRSHDGIMAIAHRVSALPPQRVCEIGDRTPAVPPEYLLLSAATLFWRISRDRCHFITRAVGT